MSGIDVSRFIDEFEAELRASRDRERCLRSLGILRRWANDPGIDEDCRRRAAGLVDEFWARFGP